MRGFKDTTLGIKKLDFNEKRGYMAVYLTDGREVLVPVDYSLRLSSFANLSAKIT